MRGDTAEEIWTNIMRTPKMADVLDWERHAGTPREQMLMPPRNSHEYALLLARGRMDDLQAIRRALDAHGY